MGQSEKRLTATNSKGLPGGEVIEARSAAGAAAVRAVLNGASVSEAYQQQSIALPPVGTPVTDSVAPWALQAGDVGMLKDHTVMGPGQRQGACVRTGPSCRPCQFGAGLPGMVRSGEVRRRFSGHTVTRQQRKSAVVRHWYEMSYPRERIAL